MSSKFVLHQDPNREWEAVARWEPAFGGNHILPTLEDLVDAHLHAAEQGITITEFDLNIDTLYGVPVRCGRNDYSIPVSAELAERIARSQ